MKFDSSFDVRSSLALILGRLRGQVRGKNEIFVEEIPARPWARFGIAENGLVAVFPAVLAGNVSDLHRQNLRVRFNHTCNVRIGTIAREETVVLIECLTTEERVEDAFMQVLSLILPISAFRAADEINEAVQDLADLLGALRKPALKSALGLWGELFVIARSKNMQVVADSWHAETYERHDFGSHDLRVEVKTTLGGRSHSFSLEQIRPGQGIRVIVASILTSPYSAGATIEDLIQKISLNVSSETAKSVAKIALKTLGEGWRQASEFRFDNQMAETTLRWIDGSDVPSIEEVPPEISNVRFTVDLTLCRRLSDEDMTDAGALGKALN